MTRPCMAANVARLAMHLDRGRFADGEGVDVIVTDWLRLLAPQANANDETLTLAVERWLATESWFPKPVELRQTIDAVCRDRVQARREAERAAGELPIGPVSSNEIGLANIALIREGFEWMEKGHSSAATIEWMREQAHARGLVEHDTRTYRCLTCMDSGWVFIDDGTGPGAARRCDHSTPGVAADALAERF